MRNPFVGQRVLDAAVARLDDIGGHRADESIERLAADRVHHAFPTFARIEARGGEAFGQHGLISGADLAVRPYAAGRLRAPRAMLVAIGPGQSTETPTLVPSSSCSNASDSETAAYLVIEYGP